MRIARPEAQQIVDMLSAEMPTDSEWMICGSWRRQALTVGDIDVMVVTPAGTFDCPVFRFPRSVRQIRKSPYVRAQNAKGIAVTESVAVTVDFWAVTERMRGAFSLFFTGPRELNKMRRSCAEARGLKLSRYGLFDQSGNQVDNGTEEDICRIIGWRM